MDPLPTMLRDFAKRANQWADVLEKKEEGTLKEVVHILETPTPTKEEEASYVTADILERETGLTVSKSPAASVQKASTSHDYSSNWRRGDYFFCESCGQRKQWFRETPPWRGAICASCYNAELARIEAARGRRA